MKTNWRSAGSTLSAAFGSSPNAILQRKGILSDANVDLTSIVPTHGELTSFLAGAWPQILKGGETSPSESGHQLFLGTGGS